MTTRTDAAQYSESDMLPRAASTGSAIVTPDASQRHISRLSMVLLAILAVLLLLYVYTIISTAQQYRGPGGVALGADFAVFWSATRLLAAGANPYNHNHLFALEIATLHRMHVMVPTNRSWVRVGNPPLMFWLMQPLAHLPLATATWIWVPLMGLVSIAGFFATARAVGWTRFTVPAIAFLLMPATALSIFYGNVCPVVFAGIGFALLWLRRNPLLAGCVATVALLKPTVALPLVLMLALFHAADWRRFVAGFTATSIVLLAFTLVAVGPHMLLDWVHGLFGFSAAIKAQGEIAPLTGLYYQSASQSLRQALQIAIVLIALLVTVVTWWRLRPKLPVPVLTVGWLWGLWFMAVPYAHGSDFIYVTAPILALLGRNGRRVGWGLCVLTLYLLFVRAISLPNLHLPFPLEPIELSLVVVILAVAAHSPKYQQSAEALPDAAAA